MKEIEYCGYNFTQTAGTDRYRIRNSVGVVVEHGFEKPNMTMQDAVRVIQRFMAIRDAVREMRGR